ncbi:hypothetical protein ACWG8W_01150 [Citricoccus zhacaiensis]|nr:hypothetical protein [Cellulosimicrobium funkei]
MQLRQLRFMWMFIDVILVAFAAGLLVITSGALGHYPPEADGNGDRLGAGPFRYP